MEDDAKFRFKGFIDTRSLADETPTKNNDQLTINRPDENARELREVQQSLRQKLEVYYRHGNSPPKHEEEAIVRRIDEINEEIVGILTGKPVKPLPLPPVNAQILPVPSVPSAKKLPTKKLPRRQNFNSIMLDSGSRVFLITDSRQEDDPKFDDEIELNPNQALMALKYRFQQALVNKAHPAFIKIRPDWFERKGEYWSDKAEWDRIINAIRGNPKLLETLCRMENDGHEPAVFMADFKYAFIGTCSSEVPKKHSNLVYDEAIVETIKRRGEVIIPKSAVGVAEAIGRNCRLLSDLEYKELQSYKGWTCDSQTKCWLYTYKSIRSRGEAMVGQQSGPYTQNLSEEHAPIGLRVVLHVPLGVPDTQNYIAKEKAKNEADPAWIKARIESKKRIIRETLEPQISPENTVAALKERFRKVFGSLYSYYYGIFKNINIEWEDIEKAILKDPVKLAALCNLESAGHEPGVLQFNKKGFIVCTFSKEAPTKHRNIVYRNDKPTEELNGAKEIAELMGVKLMSVEQYKLMNKRKMYGDDMIDLNTFCWLYSPYISDSKKEDLALAGTYGSWTVTKPFNYHDPSLGLRCQLYFPWAEDNHFW